MKHVSSLYKHLLPALCLLCSYHAASQGMMFTISNAPDVNVTLSSPYQPIDPSFDANLNISTLLAGIAGGDVVVNEKVYFVYETIIVDDIHYASPFHLSITSNNNLLCYADIKNDSTGNLNLFGLDRVVVGTGIGFMGLYGIPPPVHPPLFDRPVEVGTRRGNLFIDAAIHAAVVGGALPMAPARVGCNRPTQGSDIRILAGNNVLIHGGEPFSYAQVGFGSDTTSNHIDCDIRITCEEGNLWIIGGTDFAFAQVGHRSGDTANIVGDINIRVKSVIQNLPQQGNTRVEGGVGFASPAFIGHSHSGSCDSVSIEGKITSDTDGSLGLYSGPGRNAHGRIGHHLSGGKGTKIEGAIFSRSGQNTYMDARQLTSQDTSTVQIGHSLDVSSGIVEDSIFLECGENDGSLTMVSGDTTFTSARIGHNSRGDTVLLCGKIDFAVYDSLGMSGGRGEASECQVGHRDLSSVAGTVCGDVLLRIGFKIRMEGGEAAHDQAPVQVRHRGANVQDNDLAVLCGGPVILLTGIPPGGLSVVEMVGQDSVSVTAGDSICLLGGDEEARITVLDSCCGISLRSLESILCKSMGASHGGIFMPYAGKMALLAGEDIELAQPEMIFQHPDANAWIQADFDYLPGGLWQPQFLPDGLDGPFGGTPINQSSPMQASNGRGAVIANQPAQPTQISTDSGRVTILSKSIDRNGDTTDLQISDNLDHSLDLETVSGTFLVGMQMLQDGTILDAGDSYRNIRIENWNFINTGHVYLNCNHEIDVIFSEIDPTRALLLTDTPFP